MQLDTAAFLQRLSKVSWLPLTADKYLTNPEGRDPTLNLAWVLSGKPFYFQPFNTAASYAIWHLAQRISMQPTKDGTVADYLTLLKPPEFLEFIENNPEIFCGYMPIELWRDAFRAKVKK